MWIASKLGFYSIVQRDGAMCIRARKRDDLESFRGLMQAGFPGPVHFSESSDYPYRCFMTPENFSTHFHRLAETIDYPDFKSEVAMSNPSRAQLYGRVWSILQAIEREEHHPS